MRVRHHFIAHRHHKWSVAQLIGGAMLGVVLSSCSSEAPTASRPNAAGEVHSTDVQTTTVYGAPVAVGQGTARTFITYVFVPGSANLPEVPEGGFVPSEIGVALTPAALQGLPSPTDAPFGQDYLLPLPLHNTTRIQVVALGWNPAGHPPVGVYTVPHFDFHFYTISAAERAQILPTAPFAAEHAANYPPELLRPPGYIAPAPEIIPFQGVHWIDPRAPEFNGQPFTSTFIYGSWNGRYIFLEPMVTKAFLESRPDQERLIPFPRHLAADGYFVAGYRVRWAPEENDYRVSLTKLGELARRNEGR